MNNRLLGKKFEQDLQKADFGQLANQSNMMLQSKELAFLKDMAHSRPGTRNTQDEPEIFCNTRKKGNVPKPTKTPQ